MSCGLHTTMEWALLDICISSQVSEISIGGAEQVGKNFWIGTSQIFNLKSPNLLKQESVNPGLEQNKDFFKDQTL